MYTVTVTDGNYCEARFPIEVMPGTNYDELDLNNVFSPNGDGINDVWVIGNLELYPDNELIVLNRWGNEVYTQKSYLNNWDGSDLLDGTYFFVLNVTMCGDRQSFNGYITVLR
jgi:gliding motility-associated-like protein